MNTYYTSLKSGGPTEVKVLGDSPEIEFLIHHKYKLKEFFWQFNILK